MQIICTRNGMSVSKEKQRKILCYMVLNTDRKSFFTNALGTAEYGCRKTLIDVFIWSRHLYYPGSGRAYLL